MLGRYKDMLLDIPDDPGFSPSGVGRNLLGQALMDKLGLTPPQYAALTLAIIAKYFDPHRTFKADFHFPVDVTKHFANSQIEKPVVDKYFRLVSQSRSEYLDDQKAKGAAERVMYDFRSFMLKPLIHLDGSTELYPTSLTYLQRLLEAGLPWVASGGSYDQTLRNYWGQVFEFYCQKICRRIETNSNVKPRYFADLPYGSPSRRKRSCDAILVYGQTAVIIEFKTKMPRVKETIVDRDFDAFMGDMRQAFIGGAAGDKGVAQIDATIHAIRNGDLKLPGIQPQTIRVYFPVVVTLGAWPLGPLIYEVIRREMHVARLLRQTSYTAPVEIWSSEEFERVESVLASNATSMGDLIREKQLGNYGSLSMNVYLSDRYGDSLLLSPYLRSKRDEMFEVVKAALSLQE